jgi:hypothetical protein
MTDPMASSTQPTPRRLPDFIFGRAHAIEQKTGVALAGTLVTDIAKTGRVSKRDQKLIARIIRELAAAAERDPYLTEAGVWRGGTKPADGLAPPLDGKLMRERCQRCICIAVHVDRGREGKIKLDSDLLRQIGFGRDGRPLQ